MKIWPNCPKCGRPRVKQKCTPCSRKYMREYMINRYKSRREECIRILGGVCVDCGAVENLQFDHVESEYKDHNISNLLISASFDQLLLELVKCVLRCERCHFVKSRKDRRVNEHGGGLIGIDGCKCQLCRDRKAIYMKNYYKK